jgi:hypothetical protein
MRLNRIVVFLTDEEWDELRVLAHENGLPDSALTRMDEAEMEDIGETEVM